MLVLSGDSKKPWFNGGLTESDDDDDTEGGWGSCGGYWLH